MPHSDNCACSSCDPNFGTRRARGSRGGTYGAPRDTSTTRSRSSYGQNTRSGAYGRGSFSYQEATFDGLPALKRRRDGKLEFFYGPDVKIEGFLEDHEGHGHAIIKDGKLIYKRRPGQSRPDIDLGG